MAAREDRVRVDPERELFEAYAESKGYNLTRESADKYYPDDQSQKNGRETSKHTSQTNVRRAKAPRYANAG